jgi:Fe-S cluster assembly protein SufB
MAIDWRLRAFRSWTQMEELNWARIGYPPIDYQGRPLPAPAEANAESRRDRPELIKTYELGIPCANRSGWPASPSMPCSTASPSPPRSARSRGIRRHLLLDVRRGPEASELIRKYLGSVVPYADISLRL